MKLDNMFQIMFQIKDECNAVLGDSLTDVLNDAYTAIEVIIPVLLVVLIIVDFVKAITASDDKEIKEAQKAAIKRILIAVIIFFLPLLINIILKLAGIMSGTCGIG